jgi:hypothetical protein
MISASPSNWSRLQPRVRFRDPASGEIKTIILHPVAWLPGERRLLRIIERWRATQTSPEPTSISGFQPVAGQPFCNPTLVAVVRSFVLCGGMSLVGGLLVLHADWGYIAYALAVAACAHIFMFLPALLYHPPAGSPDFSVPVDAR